MNLFSINELSFTYPNGCRALDCVSFDVPEGAFITVCGLSGCGKSTLLRLLKPGLEPHGHTGGEILCLGSDIKRRDMKQTCREIGFVMQNPDSQLVTDKVWHELAFSLESAGLAPDEIRRRVSEMACYFGFEGLFGQNCDALSGGQKQLLNLAAAAALHPRVLLLDEPSSQLDPISSQSFIDALSRLNRDFGVTIIIAEHRLEELLHLSDKVVVLGRGKVICDCAPRDICKALPADHPIMAAMPLSVQLYARGGGRENAPLTLREAAFSECCRSALSQPQSVSAAPAQSEPLITARQLWVSFAKDRPDVLSNCDITIYSGKVCAILGSNGSGKTTLLKCLCGSIKPLGGKVRVKKGVTCGYLPQNPCELFTEETVLEELSQAAAQYEEAAQRFSLTELYSVHPYDLSGGEQQRLALAKLMLKKPDVLLLDEPTKGVDAAARMQLCSMLRALAREGCAIVIVTHDVSLAESCADECCLLFNGEITTQAEPSEFFRNNYFYTTPAAKLRRMCGEACEGHG
ncbi:MAG: ABC transporter ATP-binding protein [Oscillospiraceae bacterium]